MVSDYRELVLEISSMCMDLVLKKRMELFSYGSFTVSFLPPVFNFI